jgi:hypothetical protein
MCAIEQAVENLISMTECHLGRLKPLLILWRLRRGHKPRPFTTGWWSEFSSSLLERRKNSQPS